AGLLERLSPLVRTVIALDEDGFLGGFRLAFLFGIVERFQGGGFDVGGASEYGCGAARAFRNYAAQLGDRQADRAGLRNRDDLAAVRILAGRALPRQLVLELVRVIAKRTVEDDRHDAKPALAAGRNREKMHRGSRVRRVAARRF